MIFEFEADKNASNIVKHGIDFETAKALWNDDKRVEAALSSIGEKRSLVIGIINNKHWSAIITYRNDNIRLISVRRSRKEEIEDYENF